MTTKRKGFAKRGKFEVGAEVRFRHDNGTMLTGIVKVCRPYRMDNYFSVRFSEWPDVCKEHIVHGKFLRAKK